MMSRLSLPSSLLIPDAPSWHDAVGYSWKARDALMQAYEALQHVNHDAEAYRRAYRALIPFRTQKISLQQRMNAEFVLAQAYASEEDLDQAATSTEVALEVASMLTDRPAEVELHYLRGSVADERLHLREANTHYAAGLQALRSLRADDQPADAAYELTLLIRTTAMSFELAEYERALEFLTDAHALQSLWVPSAEREAAHIAWLGAQLLRWHGELDEALTTAMTASDLLLHVGPPAMSGRIQTIVAEIALDRAQGFSAVGSSGAREALATLAQPFARRALARAHDSRDTIGVILARLALLRIDRMRGGPTSQIPALESLVGRARKKGDAAVSGRALTALGDDFAAHNEYESARNCYRQAWRLLEEHELRAMAQQPRKSFFKLGELRTDDDRP